MHQSESNGSGFGAMLGTFILGAATGAAVALLTAPKTGREAREWLKDTALDLGESMERIPGALKQVGSKAVHAGQEAYGQAKEELSQAAYKAEDRIKSRIGSDKFAK